MSYTPKTTGAKLYVGTSDTLPPPAVGSDTFVQVLQVRSIQEPPIAQTPSSFYILDTPDAQSNGSPLADRDWSVFFYRDKSNAQHNILKADAKVAGGRLRNIRMDTPDGIRHDFVGFVTNYAPEAYEASGDAQPPHGANVTIRQTGAGTEGAVP